MGGSERDPYLDPDQFEQVETGRPTVQGKRPWVMPRRFRWALLGAVVVGVALGIGIANLRPSESASSALPSGHPALTSTTSKPSPTPVDPVEVATLKDRLAKDPSDAAALKTLVARYVGAFDGANAASYQGKVVGAEADDVDARLVLGVYQLNAADLNGAEQSWLEVTRRRPQSAEAYYNLGFLYVSRTPADHDKARAAWQRVIEIAPSSEMGQWVSAQLGALPTATASATGTPMPSARPT